MNWIRIWLPVAAVGFTAGTAIAATSHWEVDTANTVPGTVANALFADGEGDDWTAAAILIDLTAGSVYNDPAFDSLVRQAAFWPIVPALQWDSAVGIAGDGTTGIAGGCAAIGCSVPRLDGTGPGAADITWFNTATGDLSLVQIANITLTDDAAGTWELVTVFAGSQVRLSGAVVNGVVPEPTTLGLMGLGGLAVLRRR